MVVLLVVRGEHPDPESGRAVVHVLLDEPTQAPAAEAGVDTR